VRQGVRNSTQLQQRRCTGSQLRGAFERVGLNPQGTNRPRGRTSSTSTSIIIIGKRILSLYASFSP
jgi:hypothetical protein